MSGLEFQELCKFLMVLFQKLQCAKGLLGRVSSGLDHLYKMIYTSGLEVSFAAVENWLAARSCSSLAAMAVAAFKALRAWDCACTELVILKSSGTQLAETYQDKR